MSHVSEQLKKMQESRKAYKEALKKDAEGLVKQAIKEFFAANPTVQSICWSQYTPYFNDGEPCRFSVNDMYFSRKAYGPDDDMGYGDEMEEQVSSRDFEYKDLPNGKWERVARNPDPEWPLCLALVELIDDDELLLNAFGDHVSVLATPQGIHVSDYSHD